jgi:hypothetical protein
MKTPRKRLARQIDRDIARRLGQAFLDMPAHRGTREDGAFLARALLRFAADGTFEKAFGQADQATIRALMGDVYLIQRRRGKTNAAAIDYLVDAFGCDMRTARSATRAQRESFKERRK